MIGAIVINKPKGITSSNVVVKVRKALHGARVGHLGTLDPLATGVLVVCIGKATRLFDYFLNKEKTYIAEFTFGYETDTLDSEGKIVNYSNCIPTIKKINNACKNFIGKISQYPPMFSAKSINGKKAYHYARQGKVVDLKPCNVTIYQFELLEKNDNVCKFLIRCSSGTYIRSLCRDLAHYLGAFATMTNLVRTKVGIFDIKQAIEADAISYQNIEKKLIPLEQILGKLTHKDLNDEEFKKLINGVAIETKIDCENIVIRHNGIIVGIAKAQNGMLKIVTNLYQKE